MIVEGQFRDSGAENPENRLSAAAARAQQSLPEEKGVTATNSTVQFINHSSTVASDKIGTELGSQV